MIHSLKNSSDLIKISCTQEAFNVHFNKNRAHVRRTTAVMHLLRWHSGMKLPAMQEMQKTQVRSLGQEDPLEEEMATHSSILSWRIPWTEESGRLQSMGLQRVGHNWATEHTHRSSNWSSHSILFHTSRFPSPTTTISTTSLPFAPCFSDLVTSTLSSIPFLKGIRMSGKSQRTGKIPKGAQEDLLIHPAQGQT